MRQIYEDICHHRGEPPSKSKGHKLREESALYVWMCNTIRKRLHAKDAAILNQKRLFFALANQHEDWVQEWCDNPRKVKHNNAPVESTGPDDQEMTSPATFQLPAPKQVVIQPVSHSLIANHASWGRERPSKCHDSDSHWLYIYTNKIGVWGGKKTVKVISCAAGRVITELKPLSRS